MSVTWKPPVVWKCRSAWKTFIAGDFNGYCRLTGPVAQRLEQRTHNSLAGGSNPPGPFIRQAAGMKTVGVPAPRYESGRKRPFHSLPAKRPLLHSACLHGKATSIAEGDGDRCGN